MFDTTMIGDSLESDRNQIVFYKYWDKNIYKDSK